MVFLKEIFKNVDFEKSLQTTKKHEQFPRRQRVKKVEICFIRKPSVANSLDPPDQARHFVGPDLIWVQTVYKGY